MKKLKWINPQDLAIKRTGELVNRDEYLNWMNFKGGKVLFTELFGPLVGLKENWEEQGATEDELNFSAYKYRIPNEMRVNVFSGRLGKSLTETSRDEEEINYISDLGCKHKLCYKCATIPLPEEYPIKNMDDWLKIKHLYQFSEERFGTNWEEDALQAVAENKVIKVTIPGGFDEPRQLLGEENLCFACYEEPELIDDILNTISDTALQVFERVTQKIQVDALYTHDDIAGKGGSLFGPQQVERFMKPYYRKIWDFLESKGAKIFIDDSDGNINTIIDSLMDCGINCIYPCEPAANMDIVKIREKYGKKLMIVGGINKFVLAKSQEEITAELEYKIPAMIKSGGGYMIGADHRIPTEVSLENYKFYINKVWEIIDRETKN